MTKLESQLAKALRALLTEPRDNDKAIDGYRVGHDSRCPAYKIDRERACSSRCIDARRAMAAAHAERLLPTPEREVSIWTKDDIVARCTMCGAHAIVALTPVLLAKQPDDTTHVCHPGFGGCNHGFVMEGK